MAAPLALCAPDCRGCGGVCRQRQASARGRHADARRAVCRVVSPDQEARGKEQPCRHETVMLSVPNTIFTRLPRPTAVPSRCTHRHVHTSTPPPRASPRSYPNTRPASLATANMNFSLPEGHPVLAHVASVRAFIQVRPCACSWRMSAALLPPTTCPHTRLAPPAPSFTASDGYACIVGVAVAC